MRLSRSALAACLLVAIGVGVTWATLQTHSVPPEPLAAFVPSGALLSIESPDFASLLQVWDQSVEQRRWLSSGDYAGFSRSKLFDRLGQAQSEFATTAGLTPNLHFLQQVAGTESLLAWYDIGNLEFLYITRLPAGQAPHTPLLQLRDRFEQRSAGGTPFYVRSVADTENGGPERTVAFAVKGDYLLLATREDLLAGALALMQQPGDRTLLHDAWYSSTASLSDGKTSDLRLSLNLGVLARSPYFRSYWVQQNITEMAQYTAARSDLYRSAGAIREERTLIPADRDDAPATTDLGPVLSYLPNGIGVYRAESEPSVDGVLAAIDEKLLTRAARSVGDAHIAPTADLTTPVAGDASDFDERIDTPIAVSASHTAILAPLHDLLESTAPTAVLTFSTATQAQSLAQNAVFLPIHSAVVLESKAGWSATALELALDAALQPQLSVAGEALRWSQQGGASQSVSLSGPQHLVFSVQGSVCILASDEGTLEQLLAARVAAPHTERDSSIVAGFNHAAERMSYMRLTRLLDHTAASTAADQDAAPAFFSGNIASLSDTFRDLEAETFTQRTAADHTVRQTVVYKWNR